MNFALIAAAVALPSFILSPLLSLVLPAVVGALVTPVYAAVKRASSFVDNLPAQVHVIVVAAISFVLPQLGHLVPGFAPSSLDGIDTTAIQALLTFVASQVAHLLTSKPSTPAPVLAPKAPTPPTPAK